LALISKLTLAGLVLKLMSQSLNLWQQFLLILRQKDFEKAVIYLTHQSQDCI